MEAYLRAFFQPELVIGANGSPRQVNAYPVLFGYGPRNPVEYQQILCTNFHLVFRHGEHDVVQLHCSRSAQVGQNELID